MIIISIDPGLKHTGIAMRRYCGNICYGIFLATIEEPILYGLLNKLARFSNEIVIEQMPLNLQYPLSEIVNKIRDTFKDKKITFISPSTWKPFCKVSEWKVPFAKTQHEEDAFLMLEYYLLFYRGGIKDEKYT